MKKKKATLNIPKTTVDDVVNFANAGGKTGYARTIDSKKVKLTKEEQLFCAYLHAIDVKLTDPGKYPGLSIIAKRISHFNKKGNSRVKKLKPYLQRQINAYLTAVIMIDMSKDYKTTGKMRFVGTAHAEPAVVQYFLNLNGYSIVGYDKLKTLDNSDVDVEFTGVYLNEESLRESLTAKGVVGRSEIALELETAEADDLLGYFHLPDGTSDNPLNTSGTTDNPF